MPDDLPVSPEVRIYGDERRNQAILKALESQSLFIQRIYLLLLEAQEEPNIPIVNVAPTDLSSLEKMLLGREPVVFDPEAIADALAKRLPQDRTPEIADALSKVAKELTRINKKVSAMSIMPSGGSSGHVIVDSGQISSIAQPVEIQNEIGNPIGVSFPKPTYKVANALVSVPAGAAFATVVEATPTVAFTVQGFGADLNSTAALTYRYRLITGTDASPTIIDMEQISAGDNSKRALLLSVAANTRAAIQVNHGDVVPQDFRATLNWSEEP